MNSTAERIANRSHCRKLLDVRVKFLMCVDGCPEIVHGRTRDLSNGGVGVILTRELDRGETGVLVLRFPKIDLEMHLPTVVMHRRGFRCGLCFGQLTSEQQFLINGICGALPN